MCLSTSKRNTTSAGVPGRPRVAALLMPLGQGLVDRRHDLRVAEQLIGVFHPRLMQILHFFGDQPIAEATLRTMRLNHASPSSAAARRRPAAAARG